MIIEIEVVMEGKQQPSSQSNLAVFVFLDSPPNILEDALFPSIPSIPPSTSIMAVKLRLARNLLTRNNPSYKIVATPSTLRTTAKPLEILGTYNATPVLTPRVGVAPNGLERGAEWGPSQAERVGGVQVPGEKSVVWNEERVRWWLKQGALPSKRVERLLISAGILSESGVSSLCTEQNRTGGVFFWIFS